jgi:sigma-B regulation protein RsbU (phosphoserine phosphatase)
VFLYSDGIIEHADAQGDMFGPQRLYRKLQQQSKRQLAAACDQIIETLRTFGQKTPFRDDVTLLGIEFGGAGKP